MSPLAKAVPMAVEIALQADQEFPASPEGRTPSPSGPLDWVLLGLAIVVVIGVIALCVRYFLRPEEESDEHIKRQILRDEVERPGSS